MFKNNNINLVATYCVIIVLLVIGSIYLTAPIYQFICRNTEYFNLLWNFLFDFDFFNKSFDLKDNLILRINFYINISDDLPWNCAIDLKDGFCNIGEPILRTIRISNECDNSVTAIALVDILPSEYKGYFNKQQCFCFEPIRLYPWETIYLPIIFNVLPDLYTDFQFGLSKSVIILYSFIRIGW